MASTSTASMDLPRANGSSYDVFLSFRGEDTRHSFTDHLYAALEHAGIKTFRDSNDAERGEELKKEIDDAIKASDGSIIVLSENYATSTWCLDELSLILDRRRDCHHSVLPVFYKVDPSDVRKQKGTFYIQADPSSRRWTDDNVIRWKAALTEVADLIGELVVGSEVDFLKKIVDAIYNRLYRKKIYIPPNLIGMDAREKEIKSWINQSESKFLVIYGMAGSGKSTLAQYIVYSNFQSFESVSIVEHIGRKCKEPHDMVKLQKQLCKDMLRGKDRRIPSVCQGTPTIEVLLEQTKALIVLDDIVKESQLEDLLGSGNINKESKIIVTTDNDISNWFELKSRRCEEYKMKLLNDEESLELLSLHAFRSKTPMDGFKELAKRVVEYCEGSPLALEVLGSSLSKDNSIKSWKSALNLLGKDIHSDIYDVLKRSYDSLPYDSDKELFLHIACFFVGKDMDYIVKILEPEYSAESKIKTLIKRCFLYVTPNKQLMMHRLLQDMGRSLVDRESRILAERSRLWRNKDSYDLLRRGKSSDLLKGLTLDMHMLMEEDEFNSKQLKESPLTTDSLQRMDQLKLLQLNFVKLTGSYKDSSHRLLWLCWFGYNESIIDSDIFMGNMVALDLSYSRLKEFEPPTVLQSLKILNFKDSCCLVEIRNIHLIPNLETLILWNCPRLLRVCKTIGNLEKLALLNMTGCENLYNKEQLNSLAELKASTSGGESTQELSFPLPHSLQRLFLKNCKLECTDYFPLSFSDQSSLQYLNLVNSLFEKLPCYSHLKNLRVLDLSLCSRLKCLLCLPSTLAELYVYYCKSIEKITFESGRFTLQEFGYEGCINLSEIEGLLRLVLIAKLDETDLGHLMWLKEYENHDVCLVGDDGLTKDRSCRLQMLYEFNIMSTSLPDIKHPNLTPEYASQYTCLSFDVPSCPRSRSLKGLDVTFRYRISGEDWAWFCKISVTGVGDLIYNPKVFGKPASGKVGIWLSYWPIGNSLVVGDEVKVSIIVIRGLEVLECGARLVYTDDDVTGEILENKMGWVETLGGDLSGFQLITGAYYLCRRDFFEQMEVGRLAPDWFSNLVGDHIDSTEVRGWGMTGRPRQLYQSFTELKTVRCIMYEPETTKQIVQNMEFQKALEFQEDFETWKNKLPINYREILKLSNSPEKCSSMREKDIYNMLCHGISLQDSKLWFSIGSNGERNEMISAITFSYKNRWSRKWQSIETSRFKKVAEMLDVANLNIQIKNSAILLLPGVNYSVHLVFKFCYPRKYHAYRRYVNLKYKMGNQNLSAYFATLRKDGWMTIELCRFSNQKKDINVDVLLESFSRCYCDSHAIYIEGIEFRTLDNVKQEEIRKSEKIQEVSNSEMDKSSSSMRIEVPAEQVLYDTSNKKLSSSNISSQSRSEGGGIELLKLQVFRIKCNIGSQMGSRNTKGVCYLVFKLSESCSGLHCPVIVRDQSNRRSKETGILYFRSPSPWNLVATDEVPKKRGDGWMEVIVGIFNSDCRFLNLKLSSYEGTMSGLIVRNLELRPS